MPPLPFHSYSATTVQLAINWVLKAALSYRACEKVARTLDLIHPDWDQAPQPNTVQNWILRVGLHELTRVKERADDWILLVDHTIQLGNEKCLVIVGIRLSRWRELGRPIRLTDLSVIGIEVVDTSNGDVVCEQLQKAKQQVGQVTGIISDQGSDLVNGIARFKEINPRTIGLTDMAHRTATALKHGLEKDPQWVSFLAHCGKTQPRAKQTELGCLLPPKLKVKARYMNLHSLIGWSDRMLGLLDIPIAERPKKERLERLNEKFGWLLEYREPIAGWRRLMQMVDITLKHSREVGFTGDSAKLLSVKLSPHAEGDQGQRFCDEVVAAVESNSVLVPEKECFPASSEILESLIGKGKQLGRQQSRQGFTRNLLAMAASVIEIDTHTIRESFAAVNMETLKQWVDKNLTMTMTKLRRIVLPTSPKGTNMV